MENKRGSTATWTFSIIFIYVLIIIMSIYFGKSIIRNSEELTDMYGTDASTGDSLSLLVKIATFQVGEDVAPYWVGMLLDTFSLIVVILIIMVVRGIS